MIKSAFTIIIIAMLGLASLRAALSEKDQAAYRDVILKEGAHTVLKTHPGKAYLFEITTRGRTVEALFVFGEDVMKETEGDVFVRVDEATARPDAQNCVGWMKITATETARFFYVIGNSEVLNLGQQNIEDPFKIEILSQGTAYKCIAKRQGKETIIERKRGDSLPADYFFDYLEGAFIQRLETQ